MTRARLRRVERARDVFEEIVALRVSVAHLQNDTTEVKQNIRRVDDRIFQLLLLQVGTLATALASLVALLVS
jgi:hypothetical protein